MFHLHAGHHPILFALVVGLGAAGPFLTIADLRAADKRIAEAILDSLAAIRMVHKVACDRMGYSKGQWSRILSCDLHVSLTRLKLLGLDFNAAFMPRYLAIVAAEEAEQIVSSAKERGRAHAA